MPQAPSLANLECLLRKMEDCILKQQFKMREQKKLYFCRYLPRLQKMVYWQDWFYGKVEDKCLQATHTAANINNIN